jgi:hypothetical protein
MGVREIACRSRQALSKWWDRVAPAPAAVAAEDPAAGEVLLRAFQEEAPSRFFAGATGASTLALLAGRMPGAPAAAIEAAEGVCLGRFDLLGYHGLSFGQPVDWHFDPLSGRRAPLLHWSRLDPLDAGVVGDSKVIYELSRQQWLVTLGQAYRATGDERYADAFASYVRAWIAANPRGMGINWASSLELALRIISWSWALLLFRSSEALTADLFVAIRASIRDHASHVERYLSSYFAPNTHLTGEALGLFYAGVLFPDLARAKHWRALGARILADESERQVWADGVYFEQSTCYQRYTLEIHFHFLALAERNGVAVPAIVSKRARAMLDFLMALRRPDGTVPEIGDADGGWLLPLVPRRPLDMRGIFSTAAALFGRADYAWAAGRPAPETLWLLGPAGLDAFEAVRPEPPRAPASRLFPCGGYAVMRNTWQADGHALVFDAGPLSSPLSGHGHADLLSIQCSVFGQPCLVDAGTYAYADPEWREFFRGTAAHSTVLVDGESQAVPAGPFQWAAWPRAKLRRWISTDAADFADAEHDAYHRLSDPVTHRRRVLFVKPRYWVVVDDLDGAAEHRLELRFQFGPADVALGQEQSARARVGPGSALVVRPFATVPLAAQVRRGERRPVAGWVSPEYGQRRPAPVLIYSAAARLPVRIVTVLLPTRAPSWPSVSALRRAGRLVGLEFSDGESVSFTEDAFEVVAADGRPF